MSAFLNLKITWKLIASFTSIIVIFVIAAGMIMASLAKLDTANQDNIRSVEVLASSEAMLGAIIQQENALRGFAMLGREDLLGEYEENRAAFAKAATAFETNARAPEQLQNLKAMRKEVADLNDRRFAELIRLARDPSTRGQAQHISGQKQLPKIREIAANISARQQALISNNRETMAAAAAAVTWTLMLGIVVAALSAAALGWLLSRTIARPLTDMTGAMSKLADGDTGIDVPAQGRGDEIGQLANALIVFRQNARDKHAADIEAKRSADDQKFVVDTISTNLASLAAGDLTADITSEFPASYGQLKTNFNDALQALRALIGTIVESTVALRTGSTEIAQASEDLARRTEGNAASLEETSAAITQMEGRLKATADAAERTVSRADEAIGGVASGRSTAELAMQGMGRVSESAKGIDNVIEGLDKIAFQTRVLAMNAAVEAGRAGEAGRGFAVVADLVSALAMRAEEEAGRAREQLTVAQTDIVSAVELVQGVDSALAKITTDVGEVHALLGEMAKDNQALSATITEISGAVSAMDHSTQQNAAMVEQTSAAARNLTSEVKDLASQAGQFKVDGSHASSTARAVQSAPARKVEKPAVIAPLKPSVEPHMAVAKGALEDWAAF